VNLEERFSRIVSSNAWGSRETVCGPGSTLEACAEIIQRLPVWISTLKIRSIVDLGCGDFHWLKEVDLTGVQYDGYDIVRTAVEAARKHEAPNIRFHHADVLSIEIPRADLVLCKDVLIHLPDQEALSLVHAIVRNGSHYLASTSSPGWPNMFRTGMRAGEFAPIDLEHAPYALGAPLDAVEVPRKEGNPRKFLALWRLEGILDVERRSL